MSKLKSFLKRWLEVPEKQSFQAKFDELNKEIDKAKRDVDFWKRELKKRQPTKKCTICKEPINLWPFEDTGYYIKGNRVEHTTCQIKE
jgi:hypothetical protein